MRDKERAREERQWETGEERETDGERERERDRQ